MKLSMLITNSIHIKSINLNNGKLSFEDKVYFNFSYFLILNNFKRILVTFSIVMVRLFLYRKKP